MIESISKRNLQAISIAIPVAVALILGIRQKIDLGNWTKVLPHCIGIINSLTAIILCLGYYFIKQKNIKMHRKMMSTAFILGSIFLIFYILYHISNPSTKFGGQGFIRYVYYFLLISHIGLSIVVVRFVLFSIYYALIDQIDEHKKMVKYTFPLWLYVSLSGVLVYLLISPYYV